LDHAVGNALRQPSPQPTHLGIPGTPQHRVLSEEDPGYIAATFEGKQKQMEQGQWKFSCCLQRK
jgi:glutamate dehydrogenase